MIAYTHVTKKYGSRAAARDISLVIRRGEGFGLLGPNGAGKTTLIRMTTALTRPDSGVVQIDGAAVGRNRADVKRKLGVVPQNSTLERDLSAAENLEYHGKLYGMPKEKRRKRMEELLDFALLAERRNDKITAFSGGMLRKMMIVKALMHEPEILLLDEPTAGLDAFWRRKIWDLLLRLKQTGITMLLTTHYLEEAGILCDRIGLIDKGVITRTGTPGDIISEAGPIALEYFEAGETKRRFFKTREAALAAAGELLTGCKIREATLEDAFIFLSEKPALHMEA
ncbi:MAG: ABC transporter ATP-binding protein [Treponema sp.]|nr:ABC transporter ATP-binding protein [Treponema sp.]